MAYLVTNIAIFLVFAQLLGLLLGWLLWGYVAKQRGQEVQSLRERMEEMHLASSRLALAAGQQPLPESQGSLIEGDLPGAQPTRSSFMPEEEVEQPVPEPVVRPVHVAPDLEAEVKEARLRHLEQQVRELEGARDRLPLLQADLSDAIAARRTAESKFQEAKNDFEVRSSSLLMQIRDFEQAAQEWDGKRAETERAEILKDKELATVKAHLRDLQNSQRPQTVEHFEAAPSASAIELADLRDRYQRAINERDSIAAELEFWKQNDGNAPADAEPLKQRVAELEETIKAKDANVQEQVTRIESLLWRVAELEPFAAAAPGMEENLKRQQSEIAGHMGLHAENTEQIRNLQQRITELDADTATIENLRKQLAERDEQVQRLTEEHARGIGSLERKSDAAEKLLAQHQAESTEHIAGLEKRITELQGQLVEVDSLKQQTTQYAAEIQQLTAQHLQQHAEWQQSLKEKEREIAEHLTARDAQANAMAGLHGRISELELAAQKVGSLEKSLLDRDTEIRGLLAAHSEINREMQGWKDYSAQLQPVASQVPALEQTLKDRNTDIVKLKEAHNVKDGQLSALQQRFDATSDSLQSHQRRVADLEPLAARLPELSRLLEASRDELKTQLEKHQTELNQLKINSAKSLRRLRQGITSFKN